MFELPVKHIGFQWRQGGELERGVFVSSLKPLAFTRLYKGQSFAAEEHLRKEQQQRSFNKESRARTAWPASVARAARAASVARLRWPQQHRWYAGGAISMSPPEAGVADLSSTSGQSVPSNISGLPVRDQHG